MADQAAWGVPGRRASSTIRSGFSLGKLLLPRQEAAKWRRTLSKVRRPTGSQTADQLHTSRRKGACQILAGCHAFLCIFGRISSQWAEGHKSPIGPLFMRVPECLKRAGLAGPEPRTNAFTRQRRTEYPLLRLLPRVATEAGNSPAIVQRHYAELVKPDAAKKFFGILPTEAANVVLMKVAF